MCRQNTKNRKRIHILKSRYYTGPSRIRPTASNRRRRRAPSSNTPEIQEMQENVESGDDEYEALMGPFSGGHVDISILCNFKTHVVTAIWYNKVIILIAL